MNIELFNTAEKLQKEIKELKVRRASLDMAITKGGCTVSAVVTYIPGSCSFSKEVHLKSKDIILNAMKLEMGDLDLKIESLEKEFLNL